MVRTQRVTIIYGETGYGKDTLFSTEGHSVGAYGNYTAGEYDHVAAVVYCCEGIAGEGDEPWARFEAQDWSEEQMSEYAWLYWDALLDLSALAYDYMPHLSFCHLNYSGTRHQVALDMQDFIIV